MRETDVSGGASGQERNTEAFLSVPNLSDEGADASTKLHGMEPRRSTLKRTGKSNIRSKEGID